MADSKEYKSSGDLMFRREASRLKAQLFILERIHESGGGGNLEALCRSYALLEGTPITADPSVSVRVQR